MTPVIELDADGGVFVGGFSANLVGQLDGGAWVWSADADSGDTGQVASDPASPRKAKVDIAGCIAASAGTDPRVM